MLVLAFSSSGFAQLREREAAAEAYDRGTAAYVTGDYEEAAQWYETAHRHQPTAEALVQAARSYDKAQMPERAASLALVLLDRYQEHAVATVVAEELLSSHRANLLRVHVTCDECSLEVDGHLESERDFFLLPEESHALVAAFEDGGQTTRNLSGEAGEELSLELTPDADLQVGVDQAGAPGGERKPLDPMFVYAGGGVTVALLVLSIGLSADALGGVDGYDAAAKAYRECVGACEAEQRKARQLLADGQRRERRAEIAWAMTGVTAAATAAVALFLTDWDGEYEEDRAGLRVGIAPDRNSGISASVGWAGQF